MKNLGLENFSLYGMYIASLLVFSPNVLCGKPYESKSLP